MSLAVLVDQTVTWEKDPKGVRRVLVPPTPETLKIIHDLVAGVTGFNQERGDQLVIETLPFESTLLLEPPLTPGAPGAPGPAKPVPGSALQLDRKTLMVVGGGALGVIVVLFLLAKLLRRKRAGSVEVAGEAALSAGESPAARAALAASAAQQDLESQLAEREALQQKAETQALSSLKLAPVITKKAEILAKHLREKISKEPEVSAQILRTWIREEES
jgi:flagellar biosynthesis/type III secretory pathway M-ring protein FliF/YscJ